uniref:Uncharacterized protein n=1 Tax=Fagus sylvatica TaxID=28930 RepID=A0A2N9EL99_FAGSY
MEGESLRAYVHHFNKEAMQIDRPKEDVTLTTFMAGLQKGDFLYDLCKDPPETLSELMYEAQKHMNAEDALEALNDLPPKMQKEAEDHKQEPTKQKVPKFFETPERKRTTTLTEKFRKIRSDPSSRPKNLYCSHPENTRPPKPQGPKERTENPKPRTAGEIRTIVGGPADGGISRTSRKVYARQVHNIFVVQQTPKNIRLDDQIISFSEENARGTHQPHDDALVITMSIADFTTRQVMIDNSSSADILYLPAYQQMKLDKEKLRPMGAPLVGFAGDKVSKAVDFLVVDCPSAYNAIIGQPTLNRLRAVTSIYHPLLKFPTEHGIGEVRGDQIAARECYLASLEADGENQPMTIEEQKTLVEPSEELNTIILDDEHPEKSTRIGANLTPQTRESIIHFLKKNKDIFAWSHEDMPGYNQIVMDEADQEKKSFITCELFCYKVMPFELKNAGATYQRLMNRMFHDQIGKNVEVYIDDMLGKSKEEDDHLKDLEKTFNTLRKYHMKLNPSQPEQNQSHLRNGATKEHQRNTGANGKDRDAQSFRLLIDDKCLPFFKVLRKAFEWTNECQQAFEELKKYLATPPLLSLSKQGEKLYLYLAVSPTAVSSTLLREEEAARKLQPYFQTHTIVLLTNHPLRKAMNKLDAAGRLIQWSIELNEFDIGYQPQTMIKAQELADFIAEFTTKDDEPTEDDEQTLKWTTHINRSSTKNTSGIGIILKSPEGDIIKQAIRLQYATTTNEAEYEALLTRLKLAKILGATELDIRSDSQFIVGQFRKVKLNCIPREQNTATDQLAKSASSIVLDDKIEIVRQSSLQTAEHCDKCQRFANLVHSPPEELTPMTAPWPFAQWGLDIMGPFLIGRRQLKFLVVAIDYFTKWVEAEPLGPITEKNIQNFVWKTVICRFGIPRNDNKNTNRRNSIRMTYGSEVVVPVEIGLTTLQTSTYDDQQNEEQLHLNLDLIDKVRETTETRMRRYQEKRARHYNTKVKPRQFSTGDLVLRKVTMATKDPTQGKLGPNWEGPYQVVEIRRQGMYHLEDANGRRLPHPWNAEHLRKYYP